MRSTICLFLSLLMGFTIAAQTTQIIPRPANQKLNTGRFLLSASTVLVVKNGVDDNAAGFLNNYLKLYYGFTLKKVKTATSNYIQLTTLQTLVPGKEGAYSLIVKPTNISIQGQTASGTFYGMQTLIQLLPVEIKGSKKSPFPISAVVITDEPRFSYRGMHLDVGRHFFPVSFIKKYIDYLALHKFNTFHWHLTEDQGWRIEIKKYPKLTEVGAWRNGTIIGRYPGKGSDNTRYGGYYTQQEIKEVVKYAADRFIDVIPEIELPGHSSAAIAAYPELSCFPAKPTAIPANMISKKSAEEQKNGRIKLVQETWGVFDDVFCAGKDSTFIFLQNVIDEVTPLFPSKYFHVGGDECPKTHWKTCALCQQRMKENNLKDEHELQSYFIQRIEKYLNSKGKTIIGWDEILEGGLAPNAIVMSWRGEKGGIDAAKQKHTVIMTPGNPVYFDHTQSENEDSVTIGGYNPIEKVYAYEPIPAELNTDEAKYVLGAQANLWTEYIENTRKVEYMIFPRMAALSEVLWSPKEKRDLNNFEKRLLTQFKRYHLWKANYSTAYFDLKTSVLPTGNNSGVIWEIKSKYSRDICEYCSIQTEEEFTYDRDTEIRDTFPVFDSKDVTKVTGYRVEKTIKKAGERGIRRSPRYSNNDTLATLEIAESKTIKAWQGFHHSNGKTIEQKFSFNKATGKQITLNNPASDRYPGNGAFTLVNGVQNEKGFAKSKEFLGFNGTNCDAMIDLDGYHDISSVTVHAFMQKNSWIWQPLSAEVLSSENGQYYSSLGTTTSFIETQNGNGTMTIQFKTTPAKFVRVVIRNYGTIPDDNPGSGNKAWLMVDEIEVN
ncbi:MAG TPA: beta-N-acetylhexosaminidase [Chitinophagaceae bacterium]